MQKPPEFSAIGDRIAPAVFRVLSEHVHKPVIPSLKVSLDGAQLRGSVRRVLILDVTHRVIKQSASPGRSAVPERPKREEHGRGGSDLVDAECAQYPALAVSPGIKGMHDVAQRVGA